MVLARRCHDVGRKALSFTFLTLHAYLAGLFAFLHQKSKKCKLSQVLETQEIMYRHYFNMNKIVAYMHSCMLQKEQQHAVLCRLRIQSLAETQSPQKCMQNPIDEVGDIWMMNLSLTTIVHNP